jgi:hypothetical protein
MQTYDAVQRASIQRSETYLRKKERNALINSGNRQDLVLTLLVVAMIAVSAVGLVASVLGI